MASSPVVPAVVPLVSPSVAALVCVPSVELSPRTLMALPLATIGATTSGMIWLPPPVASSPLVVLVFEVASPLVVDAVLPELSLSPRIEMALPPIVTDSSPRIPTWFPDAVPSSPEVSAACAAPAPRTVKPPTKNAPKSARDTDLRMVSLLETDVVMLWRKRMLAQSGLVSCLEAAGRATSAGGGVRVERGGRRQGEIRQGDGCAGHCPKDSERRHCGQKRRRSGALVQRRTRGGQGRCRSHRVVRK